MPVVGTPISSEMEGNWFNTVESAQRFAGSYNVDVFSDKGDTDRTDTAAMNATLEQALDRASGAIRLAWRFLLATAEVDHVALADLTLDDDEAEWLSQTADWGTLVELASGNGLHDVTTATGSDFDGKMADLRQRLEARLQAIRDGDVLLVAQDEAGVEDTDSNDPGTFSFVPLVRDDATYADDEFAQ